MEVCVARLQAGVARAQAHQLHILLHEPGHHRQHQVRALLKVQPPYEANQRHLREQSGQASSLARRMHALDSLPPEISQPTAQAPVAGRKATVTVQYGCPTTRCLSERLSSESGTAIVGAAI